VNYIYTVYPNICAESLRTKHYWAYALTVACKALDPDHRGYIYEEDLEVIKEHYGWSTSKLSRVFQDAERMLWIKPSRGRLFLAGPSAIAQSLGISYVGRSSILLSEEALNSDAALKQAFLKAFLSNWDSKPISQSLIQKFTGIPTRTQRHYLNRSKDVQRTAIFIETNIRPQDIQHARANGFPGAFVKNNKVYVQGPNIYHVMDNGILYRKGTRTASVTNARLRALVICATGKTPKCRMAKKWYDSDKEYYDDQKKVSRGKLERRPSSYIHKWSRRCRGREMFRIYSEQIDPIVA